MESAIFTNDGRESSKTTIVDIIEKGLIIFLTPNKKIDKTLYSFLLLFTQHLMNKC